MGVLWYLIEGKNRAIIIMDHCDCWLHISPNRLSKPLMRRQRKQNTSVFEASTVNVYLRFNPRCSLLLLTMLLPTYFQPFAICKWPVCTRGKDVAVSFILCGAQWNATLYVWCPRCHHWMLLSSISGCWWVFAIVIDPRIPFSLTRHWSSLLLLKLKRRHCQLCALCILS